MPYVATGAIRMYYEEYGRGAPLLLISGTGWSGEHWKLEQVPYFSPSYRVIIFDHRGVARTDRPAERYTTRIFANDAFEMLDALGVDERVHILGHSMGGRVAQWMALDRPERVRSLILAATGPGPIDDRPRYPGITPENAAEFVELGWPGYGEEHVRGVNMFLHASPDVIERFAATHRGQFGTDLLSYLRHLDARVRHDTRDRLSEIVTDTLVVVGAEDNYSSPGHLDTSKYLAERLPNAELVVIPEVAHALHIETADTFNEIVSKFLSRH
ncbi:MAG TPA: alpha/beta hydrolase [Acidimicrobiales bacterium]|nr:alpha/beta hydrolase [Acidimicrobiales bacterium]